MTDIKTDLKEKPEGANAAALNAMADLQKMGFGSLNWMGTAWLENMRDLGSELMSFMADRIKEDVKTQHAILHCKDGEEMRIIQTDFMRKAVDQYTQETGKLVEMGKVFVAPPKAKTDS